MLHSYSFTNFQSFRDVATVSFALNNKVAASEWERTAASGARIGTALAIMGANGAGKTAALKPIVFISWFMRASFAAAPDAEIPLVPHFSTPDEPSEFEVVAEDDDGVIWRYVLRANRQRVIHEALYRKNVQFKYVFLRDWSEAKASYIIKQQGFGFAPSEARKVRQNASLISTALQYGVELAQQISTFSLLSNITYAGRAAFKPSVMRSVAARLAEDDALRIPFVNLLRSLDLGLSDIDIRETEITDVNGVKQKVWIPFGVHQTRNGDTVSLPMEEESSGTQSAFVLFWNLLLVLAYGGIAVFDELENDLHPHMLEPILSLFAGSTSNPKCAQLLFSCHTIEILDVLQKAQVAFVEKNNCESEFYRGDEIRGLRSDDNFRAKYMAGALGAVPRL